MVEDNYIPILNYLWEGLILTGAIGAFVANTIIIKDLYKNKDKQTQTSRPTDKCV